MSELDATVIHATYRGTEITAATLKALIQSILEHRSKIAYGKV